jgi:hypothetical protein
VFLAVYNDLRNQAINLYNKRAYIPLYLRIINDGRNPLDYSALGLNYIMTKQYGKVLNLERRREADTELLLKINLAHAYLLNNEYRSKSNLQELSVSKCE